MNATAKDALIRAVKTTWQSFLPAVTAISVSFNADEAHKLEVSAALALAAGVTSFLTNCWPNVTPDNPDTMSHVAGV